MTDAALFADTKPEVLTMAELVKEKLARMLEQTIAQIGEFGVPRSDARRMAADLMHNGVTVQEWIPVTERLPEKSGQYIVCCDDSFCSYGEGIWYQSGVVVCAEVYVGINEGICWEWRENATIYDLDGIVTHWMPLPDPLKMDGGAEND